MRDLQYLNNVANDMMGKLGLWEIIDRKPVFGDELGQLCGHQVSAELRKWSPERLGAMAALGRAYGDRSEVKDGEKPRTSLYEVHCCTWLNEHGSGFGLLLRIATTTVLAAMTDIIKKRFPTGTWMDDYAKTRQRGMPIPHADSFRSR